MDYTVTLEHGTDGSCLGWVHELPGCAGCLADFLRWTRYIALERMRRLAEHDRASLTYAESAGAPRPELWSARKAARLVWQELPHPEDLDRPEAARR